VVQRDPAPSAERRRPAHRRPAFVKLDTAQRRSGSWCRSPLGSELAKLTATAPLVKNAEDMSVDASIGSRRGSTGRESLLGSL